MTHVNVHTDIQGNPVWEQLCTGSGSVAPSQECKSRVCSASNDIAKTELATEPLGSWKLAAHKVDSVGLQQENLALPACCTSNQVCQLAAQ